MKTRRTVLASMAALCLCGVAYAGETKRTPGVEQGAVAPDFTLRVLNSDETVQLSQRIGKRPVVLVFGSYT